MAFLFGHRKKSPPELIKSTHKHIELLNSYEQQQNAEEKLVKKSQEKITHNLASMKFMLYGDAENEPKESEQSKLVEELFASDLLLELIHMNRFEFEARKDVAQIFNFVLRQKKAQAVEYVKQHREILKLLVDGYNDPDIALNSGSILREVIRHEELNEIILNDPTMFDAFFEYVQLSTFDVASDAFATFKLMLTKHKVLCAKFLDSHFEDFCKKYNVLLQSRNYVTKRQSLKLLGELLLNRSNFNIMMKYINSPDNLKIMMNLLRGNCLPAEDHQILTQHGFMFLQQVQQHFATNDKLGVACCVDGRMEYHDITEQQLTIDTGVHRHINIESEQGKGEDATSGNQISICPTDNHRMWARVGSTDSNGQWKRNGRHSTEPHLTIHEASNILEAGQRDSSATMQFVAACEAGVAADAQVLPVVSALDLNSANELDAFLELYGYWMGAGWVQEQDGSLALTASTDSECMYLDKHLARLPLLQYRSVQVSSSSRHYFIISTNWCQYFAQQYTQAGGSLMDAGFFSWVLQQLGMRQLRLIVAGLQRAVGEEKDGVASLRASSIHFRDELQRILLHAGYTCTFSLQPANDGVPESYIITYTADKRWTQPKESVAACCTELKKEGMVWCVTVPTEDQLIMVRRMLSMDDDSPSASTSASIIRAASRPLIIGNTKAIQFEAFHVFKIFVANPKKSPGVVEILSRNKKKLIEFLSKFQKDKDADEQFNEEKQTLLNTLSQLEDLSGDAPASAPAASSSAASSSSSAAAGETEGAATAAAAAQ